MNGYSSWKVKYLCVVRTGETTLLNRRYAVTHPTSRTAGFREFHGCKHVHMHCKIARRAYRGRQEKNLKIELVVYLLVVLTQVQRAGYVVGRCLCLCGERVSTALARTDVCSCHKNSSKRCCWLGVENWCVPSAVCCSCSPSAKLDFFFLFYLLFLCDCSTYCCARQCATKMGQTFGCYPAARGKKVELAGTPINSSHTNTTRPVLLSSSAYTMYESTYSREGLVLLVCRRVGLVLPHRRGYFIILVCDCRTILASVQRKRLDPSNAILSLERIKGLPG